MKSRNTAVDIFGIIDLVLAGLNGLAILLMLVVLAYGIFGSGDPEEEIISGVYGCIIIMVPLLIGFIIFLSAGLGLMRRKIWGYYMHIVASVISFFTFILLAYSILSFVFLFQPDFRRDFFPDDGEEANA
jgi:hypothetical protein